MERKNKGLTIFYQPDVPTEQDHKCCNKTQHLK